MRGHFLIAVAKSELRSATEYYPQKFLNFKSFIIACPKGKSEKTIWEYLRSLKVIMKLSVATFVAVASAEKKVDYFSIRLFRGYKRDLNYQSLFCMKLKFKLRSHRDILFSVWIDWSNFRPSFWTIGMAFCLLNRPGSANSLTMEPEWKRILSVETNVADFTTLNHLMEAPRSHVSVVMLMMTWGDFFPKSKSSAFHDGFRKSRKSSTLVPVINEKSLA